MSINGTHEERTFYFPDEQEKNLKNDFHNGSFTKLEWPTDYLIIALIGMDFSFLFILQFNHPLVRL